jgi:probable HAF family extracellular repeat protein
MRDLGTLGGGSSSGSAINNRGEVVGSGQLPNLHFQAFLWRPGPGMQSLGTLGGATSQAIDINDHTHVVGFSDMADGNQHAFLWTAARGMEDLGTLGGRYSLALGISKTGKVVGQSETAAGTFEAFLWTRGGGMRSLGTLGEASSAFSINTRRQVVGTSSGPFLWTRASGMRPLPGGLGAAHYLNDVGQIVGFIFAGGTLFATRATLWTPTAGSLAVGSTDPGAAAEVAAPPAVPPDTRSALCALGRTWGDRSRFGIVASRACLAR